MIAYKGSPPDIQQKLQRVVEVWRARQIFEKPIQDDIEGRLAGLYCLSDLKDIADRAAEIDRNRGSGRKSQLGGSLFSNNANSAPTELQPLIPLQSALTKAEITATSASTNADTEYTKLTDPNTPAPSPPVHAARLSALLKSLSTAEGAVVESIKTRKALIEGLEKLLKSNTEAITKHEEQQAELAEKKAEIETKKRDVEDAIMRGMSSGTGDEPPRPEAEGLTPPPVESLTPTGTPPPAPMYVTTTGADVVQEQPPSHEEPPPQDPRLAAKSVPPSALDALDAAEAANAAVPARTRGADAMNGNGEHSDATYPAAKKRKMSGAAEDDFVDFLADGEEGIDADVTEMLGRD